MNRIYAIALIGIAIIAAIVLLTTEGCMTGPSIPREKPCESRSIEFNWANPDKPGECEIYAYPMELDYVRDCAEVIFINQTDKDITIVFEENKTGKLSPFLEITSISLEQNGDPNQYSKAFPVTVELSDPKQFEDFPYQVELDNEPQEEQSPRIRIGPKSAVDNP